MRRLPFGLSITQLIFVGLGFVPIACLSASLLGIIPLFYTARLILIPAVIFGVVLGIRYPEWGYRAMTGLLAGIIATGVYDVFRFGLIWVGVFGDFVPNIGRMVFSDPTTHPFWGYLWRFAGNGGAMGIAFAVLPLRGVRQGIAYGTFICCCLFGTLVFGGSEAQRNMFHLTLVSGCGAMIGHFIYGAVLGGLVRLWLLPVSSPANRKEAEEKLPLSNWQPTLSYLPRFGKWEAPRPVPLAYVANREAVRARLGAHHYH